MTLATMKRERARLVRAWDAIKGDHTFAREALSLEQRIQCYDLAIAEKKAG